MKLEAVKHVVDMYGLYTPTARITDELLNRGNYKDSKLSIRLKSGKEICAYNRMYESIASLDDLSDYVDFCKDIECVFLSPIPSSYSNTYYIPIEEIEYMELTTISDVMLMTSKKKDAFKRRAELLKKRAEEESKPSTE